MTSTDEVLEIISPILSAWLDNVAPNQLNDLLQISEDGIYGVAEHIKKQYNVLCEKHPGLENGIDEHKVASLLSIEIRKSHIFRKVFDLDPALGEPRLLARSEKKCRLFAIHAEP